MFGFGGYNKALSEIILKKKLRKNVKKLNGKSLIKKNVGIKNCDDFIHQIDVRDAAEK